MMKYSLRTDSVSVVILENDLKVVGSIVVGIDPLGRTHDLISMQELLA